MKDRRPAAGRGGSGTLGAAWRRGSPGGWMVLSALLLLPVASRAENGCSRPIQVAASPIGNSMVIGTYEEVSGAVPDFLAAVAEQIGCQFDYLVVPRARALRLAELGEIDVLPAAVHSRERDRYAQFVPGLKMTLNLICVRGRTPHVTRMSELPETGIVLNALRGFDFGYDYRALLAKLEMRNQVEYAADPATIVRKLGGGRSECTLMPALALAEAVDRAGMAEKIEVTQLVDAPQQVTGLYLSRWRLSDKDRQMLAAAMTAEVRRGTYMQAVRKHYRPWALAGVTSALPLQR